jgi:hypothetical protein
VEAKVEGLLQELGLAFTRESKSVFVLDSKHGEVRISINDDGDLVTVHHFFGVIENNPRKKGSTYAFLLRLNTYSAAKFAFLGDEDDKEWPIHVLAVANADTLDAGDLEWNIQSVLDLASIFSDDES